MKIVKEPKGVAFTVTGQGLTEAKKLHLSAIIRKEKIESKNNESVFA